MTKPSDSECAASADPGWPVEPGSALHDLLKRAARAVADELRGRHPESSAAGRDHGRRPGDDDEQ